MLTVTEAIRIAGLSDLSFVTEHGLARGRAVHATIALDLRGELATWHPDVTPYLESFRAWGADLVVDQLEFEVHGNGYVGHPDFIGKVNGRRMLLDWKCGRPEPWHSIQTALYLTALEEPTAARGAVYLKGDGSPASLVVHDDYTDFGVARSVVTLATWKIAHGLDTIKPKV